MRLEVNKEKEKKYFPIFIDLSEKKIVVIGGGIIATRRIKTLLEFAGQILVVSPEITEELSELHRKGRIDWIKETYSRRRIEDADMVIAGTDQSKVNRQIKADCQCMEKETGRQMLVSVIDNRDLCDFYFPGIVQTEDVVIGINSGGKSPTLTKQMRKKIEEFLHEK